MSKKASSASTVPSAPSTLAGAAAAATSTPAAADPSASPMQGDGHLANDHEDFDPGKQLVQAGTKAAAADVGFKRGPDLYTANPFDIHFIPGFNPRDQDAGYEEFVGQLTESMVEIGFMRQKAVGVLIVNEGGKRVVYTTNHRRVLAARRAIESGRVQWTTIPVVPYPPGTSLKDLTAEIYHDNNQQGLRPWEVSRVVQRMHRIDGWSIAEIAAKLHLTRTSVDNHLMLASAPREVFALVAQQKIAANLAVEMLRKHGSEALAKITDMIEAAASRGKTQARPKDDPEQRRAGAVRRASPRLFSALQTVRADPAYASLSVEARGLIDDVLKAVADGALPRQAKARTAGKEPNPAQQSILDEQTGGATAAATLGTARLAAEGAEGEEGDEGDEGEEAGLPGATMASSSAILVERPLH